MISSAYNDLELEQLFSLLEVKRILVR